MGKADSLRWLENRYLRRYLCGKGLEIGALWRRFPVQANANVVYLDRANLAQLKVQYSEVEEKIFFPDIVGDAAELPFASGAFNFIIASHVLEHLPFPLAALKDWYRALAPGGALLIKIPDKRFTFDVRRPRTSLKQLIAEHDSPESFDWQAHYIDFVKHVDGRMPDENELSRAVPALRSGELNIHYQVWIDEDLQQIVNFTKEHWAFDWQAKVFLRAHFYRKEATMMLLRGGAI